MVADQLLKRYREDFSSKSKLLLIWNHSRTLTILIFLFILGGLYYPLINFNHDNFYRGLLFLGMWVLISISIIYWCKRKYKHTEFIRLLTMDYDKEIFLKILKETSDASTLEQFQYLERYLIKHYIPKRIEIPFKSLIGTMIVAGISTPLLNIGVTMYLQGNAEKFSIIMSIYLQWFSILVWASIITYFVRTFIIRRKEETQKTILSHLREIIYLKQIKASNHQSRSSKPRNRL
ncbi:hypothetical protein A374_17979 [Fictibacillus macauensis ZFHKF-1]|uniref:Uncharacterized protein n=2 Tax=Fictibacillus TaxID=1329200 RepID=I8AF33_9BACL|nr:hypothetical protein A374_17979 [Fictibacillus macauensis ZFHKF-1]